MKNGQIKLAEAKNDQTKFKLGLGEIEKENSKKKIKRAKKRVMQYWNAL